MATDVLSLLETMRQQLSLAKQYLIENDKTNLQTTMTAIATNKTTADNAISAATDVSTLQPI